MTQSTLTISQFCQAHNISRGLFYRLQKQGLAPRMMHLGKRRLISVEAASEWRRDMEKSSGKNSPID